jgi:hypothetical protein
VRQFRFVPALLECLTVLLPLFFVAPSPPFKLRRGRSRYLRIATTGHLVKVFVRLINLITHRRCFLFARTALGSRGGFGARKRLGPWRWRFQLVEDRAQLPNARGEWVARVFDLSRQQRHKGGAIGRR